MKMVGRMVEMSIPEGSCMLFSVLHFGGWHDQCTLICANPPPAETCIQFTEHPSSLTPVRFACICRQGSGWSYVWKLMVRREAYKDLLHDIAQSPTREPVIHSCNYCKPVPDRSGNVNLVSNGTTVMTISISIGSEVARSIPQVEYVALPRCTTKANVASTTSCFTNS